MRQGNWVAAVLVGMSAGLGASGCFTGGVYQVPGHESLAADLTAAPAPRVTRSQQLDPSDARSRPPAPPPLSAPPPLPPGAAGGAKQVSYRAVVRAWVNGKPVFDEEVLQAISPADMRNLSLLPEPRRSERLSEVYNQTLDGIIDQEVVYQDAVHKLEAGNKKALEKLKKFAAEKFDEQMKRIRDSKRVSEEQIKEVEHILRRQTERNIISGEYVRSRIYQRADEQASHEAIAKWYQDHLNEFQRLDAVQWQDVFIAVGPKCPTVAHAKRFAEDLITQCRTNDDFATLIRYDDGDSKFRNGEGLGTRKGEIKPAEVEETLFRLKEGAIGPVIPLSTGVHIVRVTKREYAGQIPLDEKTQKLIGNKIKNQVFEYEYKQITRELRNRATIEIERDQPQ
jgi:parvulin-like peptidyl-prolyl isomerase